MTSFREALEIDISHGLPLIQDADRQALLEKLLELATSGEELLFLEDKDLQPPLRLLQARKLISFFTNKYGEQGIQSAASPIPRHSVTWAEEWVAKSPAVEDLDAPTEDNLSHTTGMPHVPTVVLSANASTLSPKSSIRAEDGEDKPDSNSDASRRHSSNTDPGHQAQATGTSKHTAEHAPQGSSESESSDDFHDADERFPTTMTTGSHTTQENARCSKDILFKKKEKIKPVYAVFYMLVPKECKNVQLCLHTPESSTAVKVTMDSRPHKESKGNIWTCMKEIRYDQIVYHYQSTGEKVKFDLKTMKISNDGNTPQPGQTPKKFIFDSAIPSSKSTIALFGRVYNYLTGPQKKDRLKIVDGMLACIDWTNLDWHEQLIDLHKNIRSEEKEFLQLALSPKVIEKVKTLEDGWFSRENRIMTALALISLDRKGIIQLLDSKQTQTILHAVQIESFDEIPGITRVRNRSFFVSLRDLLIAQSAKEPWIITWLSCLPLLRILDPDHEGDQDMPRWWKKTFQCLVKAAFEGKRPLDRQKQIQPILSADRPTTVALLSLLGVDEISILYKDAGLSPDIILDVIAHIFPSKLSDKLQNLFNMTMKELKGFTLTKTLTRRLRATMERCKERIGELDDGCLESKIMLTNCASEIVQLSKFDMKVKTIFDEMISIGIFPYLKNTSSLKDTIRIINNIWTAPFINATAIDDTIKRSVKSILSKKPSLDIICEYGHWKSQQGIHHTLLSILGESAKGAIKDCLEDTTEGLAQDVFDGRYCNDKTSPIYSEIFKESWIDQVPLQHLLNWPHMPNFLKILSDGRLKSKTGGRDKLIEVAKLVMDGITDGTVTFNDMQLVLHESERFTRIIQTTGVSNNNRLQFILKFRHTQLNKLEEFKTGLTAFRERCHMAVYKDMESLRDLAPEHIESELIKDLFEVQSLRDVESETVCNSSFKPVKLPAELIATFPGLQEVHGHRPFDQLFERLCESKKEELNSLSLTEFAQHIVGRSLVEWKLLCQTMKDASVKLETVKDIFQQLQDEEIQKELIYMCKDREIANERLNQIQSFHRILQHDRAIESIMRLQRTYSKQFTGSFDVVQKVKEKDAMLSSITDEAKQILTGVRALNDKKLEWLDAYSEAYPLVTWLHEELPTQQEVETLLDMQFFSATDHGSVEMSRATSLSNVADVFSPLIYRLPKKAGLRELLAKFQEIWNQKGSNEKLPSEMIDLSNDLDWLKTLNTRQSDAGRTALNKVAEINSRGIYLVGAPKDSTKVPDQDLDQIISVKIPDGKYKGEKYTYSELQNLQSTLVLVAGQNEESIKNVERFSEILNAVRGVAETFCKLCDSGNILFEGWGSKFFCNEDGRVNTYVDFGLAEGMLAGTKEDGKMLVHIKQVQQFMKDCLGDWAHHIRVQRKQFPVLNSFTTKQIVILRSELSKITELGPEGIPDKIFPLLQMVLPSCTREELKEAWVETVQKIMESGPQALPLRKDQPKKEEEEVIERLQGRGLHREQILRAIKESKSYDTTQILAWCWKAENIAEEKGIVDSSAIQRQETHENIMADIIRQVNDESQVLKHRLTSLWKTYLDTNTSKSLKDYLSVVHLGHMLTFLKDKCTDDTLQRRFPAFFHQGHPNLILCDEANVWTKILSIYMFDESLPLPTRDEVLLCTPQTSAEEVQLLLMRAAGDNNKIFMLVKIEQLSYKVAQQVEGDIQKLLQGCSDYRLFVICSREHQEKSILVPALFGNRIESTIDSSKDQIRTYVKNHLMTQAAALENTKDNERLSVTLVRSHRAGVGKTLWIRKKKSSCSDRRYICVPLHGKTLDMPAMVDRMCSHTLPPESNKKSLFHIDIPHEMNMGVDQLLFELVILGSLSDPKGYLWARSERDLYAIEVMPLLRWEVEAEIKGEEGQQSAHHMLELLPTVTCSVPKDCLKTMRKRAEEAMQEGNRENLKQSENAVLMDESCFKSEPFQRVYQILVLLKERTDLQGFKLGGVKGTMIDCLETLLEHSRLENPSWAELNNFVQFLNIQWRQYEESNFCQLTTIIEKDLKDAKNESTVRTRKEASAQLPSLSEFVVKAMLQMSTDFVGRSLQIAEEIATHTDSKISGSDKNLGQETVQQYQLTRKWKSSANPYVFFNPDGHTLTFLGYYVEKETMNLLDPQTKECVKKEVMGPKLYDSLVKNMVELQEDLNSLTREQQLQKLCTVMGVKCHDPDPNYVLTSDNIKKMLAIYMRFRCQIPVIVMGESGCGKTYLVNFLCRLQKPQDPRTPPDPESGQPLRPKAADIKNRFVLKIHGNVKQVEIIERIKEAEKTAKENHKHYPGLFTVVFLDEVNTTEALSLVKEVLCDHTINGEPLDMESGLRFVAACNPYKMHSEEMIKQMEEGGLGYHVQSNMASDRFGRIPMRHLVYRVEPLPQSLLPLVWDFGQLDDETEKLYIRKIVHKHFQGNKNFSDVHQTTISDILHASQCYMRSRKDECSHVSLRDPERVLTVMDWFYEKKNKLCTFTQECQDERTWALIMALGVCYHAALGTAREQYRKKIVEHFTGKFNLQKKGGIIADVIESCQAKFIDNLKLESTIAKNEALKENIFMMVVCMELRIPLFIIGKPGSSKTLSRQILANVMNGPSSASALFQTFKKVQMTVYQCSPLSTVSGIKGTFDDCAAIQRKHDLNGYVSVVVLDEVGLAEDTPEMPLKTLHHLLEHDREEEELADPHKKVGFLGLSNWSLDPAKNNRALMVRRMTPDEKSLQQTATALCQSRRNKMQLLGVLPEIANGYHQLYEAIVKGETCKEFFGLRDFYSVVKMIYAFAEKRDNKPNAEDIKHAILRNFGGLLGFDPLKYFSSLTKESKNQRKKQESITDLITENLTKSQLPIESRHLLLLTENQAALSIIQEHFDVLRDAVVIYGSSFPDDLEFTKLCRAINRVKLCMESGKTVILVNQQPIFESLYDALNQYYTYFGGERHVDIGLGSQRMKCKVHEKFKLVAVADNETVRNDFPIPLINRFEKHYLATSTVLNDAQRGVIKMLDNWIEEFTKKHATYKETRGHELIIKPGDIFVGYHKEASATIVLQVCKELGQAKGDKKWKEKVFEKCKKMLLLCATPESIILVEETGLEDQTDAIQDIYLTEQQHECLSDVLKARLSKTDKHQDIFIQVTTHSQLLSKDKAETLKSELHVKTDIVSIKAFATEHEFSEVIKSFYLRDSDEKEDLLILQCDSGNEHQDLLACCRYIITDEYRKLRETAASRPVVRARKHVVLAIQLPRLAGGCFTGFQMQPWECIHIDELHPHHQMPPISCLLKGPVSSVLRPPDKDREISEENDSERVPEANRSPGFEKLFEFCIIPAMSILKDQSEEGVHSEDKNANIRRVEKLNNLLQLLEEPDRTNFLAMMQKRIYLLQRDREEKHEEANARKWLSKVATTSREMKMLTFRSQVRQYIQNKMTGLIAGIIAFADSNNNLDILLKKDEPPWKKHMWLKMLNDEKVIKLSIDEDLGQSEPQEIPVKSHGAKGSTKKCHLPFSWKIYKQMNDLMKAERTDPLAAALKVPSRLKQNDMWKILMCSLNDGAMDDEVVKKRVLHNYLPDFVDIVYESNTEEKEAECQMVQDEISDQYNTLLNKLQKTKEKGDITLCHHIPLIHAAYALIQSRIDFFSQIVRLCPEVVESMGQEQSQSQSNLNLELRAVKSAIAIMRPSEKQLRKSKHSKRWYESTGRIAPLINQALYMDTDQFDESVSKEIKVLMNEWERIITVRMFATEVYPPKSDRTNMQVFCPLLWMKLDEKPYMTSRETMEEVDQFFQSIFNMEKTTLMRSSAYRICTTCGKELVDVYLLPCRHEVCVPCIDQQREANDVKCPDCKTMPPENTTFKKQFSSGEKQLRSFKNACHSFRMELVSRVCQSEKMPNDDGLIDLLLNNISDTPTENVDSAAYQSMRTLLLQLLMSSHPNDVMDHLDQVFTGEEGIRGHHLDLAILFTQCIEDTYYHSNSSTDQNMIKDTAGMLRGNFEALKNAGFNTRKLEAIALTRFCLSKTADWMEKIYIQKEDTCLDIFTNELLPAVRNVCKTLSWPRKFLIKVLVRRFCPIAKQPIVEGTKGKLDLSTDDRAAIEKRLQEVQGVLREVLQDANKPLAADDTLGVSKLLQMLYEAENDSTYGRDPVNLAVMWRYRLQVNFETATQTLSELRGGEQEQNELLYYFMQKEPALREAQRLPRVIKFQKLLLQTYNYKIAQGEASQIPISQFLNAREKDGDEECMELFKDYQQVWNIQKQASTREGQMETLECTTTLDKFLPRSDPLIQLARIHNNLIEQLGSNCNLGPDVNLLDVKPTHLVTYDPDKALLPLVTANCSSSLLVGQGTKVKYDFNKMEYQLTERLFEGKSKIINMETTMVFSDNLTTVHKLESLEKNITQESFNPNVETELREDTRFATDVYNLVTNLDIAIGFLHTVGGDRERYLDDFMRKDLGMDPAPLPRTTKEHCQFKHIRALWLLMCNEREKHAAQLGAIPFSTLTEERYKHYRKCLNPKQLGYLRKGLVHTKRLEKLLMELFNCIALEIIKREVNPEDRLIDYLGDGQVIAKALKLPDEDAIRVSQCMYTWRAVYDYSREVAH